jgi:(p)ppGpp synthase/HD superfamily hydrolase
MTLGQAIAFAAKIHEGQTDKGGQPYILHPLRVMMSVRYRFDRLGKLAAVLHDVVEDGGLPPEQMFRQLEAEGLDPNVLVALERLTHRRGEKYDAYIERIREDALATAVKLADLRDNMDITRIPNPGEKDLARLKKYRAAYARLAGE